MSAASDSADATDAIRQFYGPDRRTSEWFTVTQELVDQFAAATNDRHWIHVDTPRAQRESPYGGTIAHGFLTLSLLTHLSSTAHGTGFPAGVRVGVNYGLDCVRFPSAVRVGARIRLQSRLLEITSRGNGQFLVRTENEIEIEGQKKPGLVAEWLVMLVLSADA